MIRANDEAVERQLKTVISYVEFKTDDHLRKLIAEPPERHQNYIRRMRSGSVGGLDEFRSRQVAEVTAACESARRLEHASSSKTKDIKGLFEEEIQLHAFGASLRRLSRARDILAAMEVAEPFERMLKDKHYLDAIVARNADGESLSTGTPSVETYKDASGSEIASSLLRQVEADMFESEVWARVSYFAGDQQFIKIFDSFDSVLTTSAMKHWTQYYESIHLDRRAFHELLATIANAATMSLAELKSWDKSLRDLFRTTQDTKVRYEAFEAWQSLVETWKQALIDGGDPAAATRLEEVARKLKADQLQSWEARRAIRRPGFREMLKQQA